ncbi:MAG: PAS domain-containing sensor histidine kinase [Bacteroidetes bacterium]|nr:MAG: PAS domain-containing sensor histidine kinase [Bacteroidota bacterium]
MDRKNEMDETGSELFKAIGEAALRLEKATTEGEIIREVAETLHRQYPQVYLVISVITPQANHYKILGLKGFGKLQKRIESLLGMNILDVEFPFNTITGNHLNLNSNGRLNPVSGGVHALALKIIPKKVSKAIEQLMGIDTVYTMGMVLDKANFGNLSLFLRHGFAFSQPDIHFIENLGIILTIALQKTRANLQLNQDSERIKRILEVVPDGIGFLIDRVFQDVNERVCEITGYTKSELLGQSARILYPTEEEYNRVGTVKYTILRETGTGEIETIWKCKDGSLKHILVRSAAINPSDFSEGVIFTALDITKRKEIEANLSESEDRYRKLVEYSPLAIMIHNKGMIEFVNQAAVILLEYETPDQLIGKNALELVHPEDRQRAMDRIELMVRTRLPVPIAEERLITRTGKEIILQIAGNLIHYQGEQKTLVFGLDITELQRAEKEISRYSTELEEINVAKDKFFSIIAHDLKGPFNSILGFSDILFTEYDEYSDEERKHFIKNIASSAQNTYRLLENLLEWSRAQTNRLEFKPEPLELSSVINENILLHRSQAEAKDIHLFSAVEFNTRVLADENMVKTIIRNLLSNAIKFSRKRGNVRIMERHLPLQQSGKELIEVLVKDDGVGMPQNVVEQLFRIDQMVKTTGTDNEKGTGLGLILCRELVVRNGGTIWAESEPGKGSTFHFTLPKA